MKNKIRRFREIDKKINAVQLKLDTLRDEAYNIRRAMEKYVIEHKLYTNITELEKYKGKDVDNIVLVMDNGDTKDFWNDEIMKVDDKGHFVYSSYEGGVFEWNEQLNAYDYHYYGRGRTYSVVGFYDIEIDDKLIEEYTCLKLIESHLKKEGEKENR